VTARAPVRSGGRQVEPDDLSTGDVAHAPGLGELLEEDDAAPVRGQEAQVQQPGVLAPPNG
jgi:hypothetical protein